ncbi:MAG: NAD(P)H-binding protein [Bryobacteraceae bacterium]
MEPIRVVVLGATGAVGSQVLAALQSEDSPLARYIGGITVLSRRPLPGPVGPKVTQHVVDVLSPQSYRHLLGGHRAAICAFGVGEPSKVSKAEFVRIDKDAVVDFASACRDAGVRHFELLGSVGTGPQSRFFYLRVKGELRDAVVRLGFERSSFFQPSMLLTPSNRYGVTQGLFLTVWPMLTPLLQGPWKKYRGIAVERLGAAMAANLVAPGTGVEILHWPDFVRLSE